MFNLETSVATWRRTLEHNPALKADDVAELVQHLRDQVTVFVTEGMGVEDAYHRSMALLGDYATVEQEYTKVYWGSVRRRRQVISEMSGRLVMFKNYLKIALRNLLRQKGYSFINIAGLTLGMACCLIIFQYVAFETSFDTFNTKKDRIYRVTFHFQQQEENQEGSGANTGLSFGPTMSREVPGINRFTQVLPVHEGAVLTYHGASGSRTYTENDVLFVDSTFFSMFDYPLVQGNRARVLRQPNTMLISRAMAMKYFGDEEPVGKTLEVTSWENGPFTVAGVFEDVPPTSHLRFDFLFPLEGLLDNEMFQQQELFFTYLELDEKADAVTLERGITETNRKNDRAFLASRNMDVTFHLQPLTDIHLDGEFPSPATRTGDRKLVYFFILIGLITLVIALINYVNLATARAMDRAREVGVRKVVGAYRKQLIGQFLLESALTNILALVLAIGLSLLLLPVVNRAAGVEMSLDLWLDGRFWALFLGFFGLGVLLSGLYPAFMLSSLKPVSVLKGKAGGFVSRAALRKGLVVAQFVVSIALLAGTTIVYAQLGYMRSLDLGLDLEQVLVVEGPRVVSEGSNRVAGMSTLKKELHDIPSIGEIAVSSNTPGRGFSLFMPMYRETADPSTGKFVAGSYIDHDFPGVYGLELAAGQPFYEGMAVPEGDDAPILINETLARQLGFSSNEEAVNQRVIAMGHVCIVRGVIRDFQWSSAHQVREAVQFRYEQAGGRRMDSGIISMKVNTGELPATIAAVEKVYKSVFPGNPFNYTFADAAFDEQYRADRRFATLFAGFSGIAILIACLGLFGLVSFTAQQRMKEIGVRKVLGASVGSVVKLLSMDFLKLVGLAFLLAAPLAYFGMQRWLQGFAYHIDIGPGIFLLTGALALGIALLTVSYQSIKAALADPVRSLRYE